MKIADKLCPCCGQNYINAEGHDYNKCVQRCRERLSHLLDQVDSARVAFHKAQELLAKADGGK